jgi:diguanylate cyclase (GGDEF)-like protein
MNVEKAEIPNIRGDDVSKVTVSVGAASLVPDKGRSLEDLIRQADLALYDAKNSGRNAVCPKPSAADQSDKPE